jgi:protein-S-isoprenylcysteine O-methyltransferase
MSNIATSTFDHRGSIDKQSQPWATDCSAAMSLSDLHRRQSFSSSASLSSSSRGFLDFERTMLANTDTEDEEEPTAADMKPSSSSDSAPPAYEDDDNDIDNILLHLPHQPKSLAGIATRSFGLGIALCAGATATVTILLCTTSPLWRLPFFLTALALFHFLEFWTTAAYNTRAAEISSFLLTANWPGYAVAHSVAALECLATHLLWPSSNNTRWTTPLGLGLGLSPAVTAAGFALVVLGQTVRSMAMIHAGQSFNHQVQYQRRAGHVLVTDGVYGVLRHPSYFGFFWWALGTQLVMGNVVSLVGYAVVLWKFFSGRIKHEEAYLVSFFGGSYVDYRKRVPTRIPFVP